MIEEFGPDPGENRTAAELVALGRRGELYSLAGSVAALSEALTLATGSREACGLLYALARRDADEAMPAILHRLHDPDPAVRKEAAYAIEHIGTPYAESAVVSQLVVEQDDAVVVTLIIAVAWCGFRNAIEPIRRFLAGTASPGVRRNAAEALVTLRDYESVALLRRAKQDSDGRVAKTIEWAMEQLEHPPPLPTIGRVSYLPSPTSGADGWKVDHPSGASSRFFADGRRVGPPVVEEMPPFDDLGIPILRRVASKGRDPARTIGAWSREWSETDIARISRESVAPEMLVLLCEVIDRRFEPEVASEVLLRLAPHDDSAVRAAALRVIAFHAESPEVCARVLEILADEPDSTVRAAANSVLYRQPWAISWLIDRLSADDPIERLCAVGPLLGNPDAAERARALLAGETDELASFALSRLAASG